MKNTLFFFLILSISMVSCIGTDIIDVPLGNDLSKLELTDNELSLAIGQTSPLRATYFNFSGEEEAATFTWISEDTNIATVNTEGLVTGVASGQTNINVSTDDGKQATALITIVADANAVASIEVSGSSNTIEIDQTLQLSAQAFTITSTELTDLTFNWTTSNAAIATVDQTGLVTAIMGGIVDISVEAEGVNSVAYPVTVSGGDRMGTFVGLTGHDVSGSAAIITSGDENVVQLGNDFQTQSGPGLHIYISKDPDGQDFVDLGDIVSNSGAQTYIIPQNINPMEYQYVLVWCSPFSVNFGRADVGL